ncbi:MAG: acyl-CoA dehydrogenase family protein, partial [Actinomycetota bacterium]|nr:acyl-CoA dehydrogenase family protein [Actinomycetota bacterium]
MTTSTVTTVREGGAGVSIPERAAMVARVAGEAAVDVDRQARFPVEAVAELRRRQLLGASVSSAQGGEDAGIDEIAQCARLLGQACASTGMIFAMHQIQVWCLMRHATGPTLRAYLTRVGTEQLLLASATSEVNVGGDVRTSICAVESGDGGVTLTKQAPVISYGDQADAVLATARRSPDSPPSDQILVVCTPPGLALQPTTEWDTLGFRGTVSRGYVLQATIDDAMVLTDPYGDISSQTMLPVSHILWASVWLGLAESAGRKAQRFVRQGARKRPGVATPAGTRLAELSVLIGQFRSQVGAAV